LFKKARIDVILIFLIFRKSKLLNSLFFQNISILLLTKKRQLNAIMKKTFLVLFVIAIAMTGIVSAQNDTVISQPIGGDAGFYDITSSPSGAAATVDSTPVGNTPTTATVYVTGTPGHTIAVNLAGYQPWSQYFSGNPAAGQHIPVYASLVPIVQTGNIYVNSNPAGASAILDNGYDQLTTPGTFNAVSTGWHNVEVSKSGYQIYSTSIEVKPGATSNVYATLVPNAQYGSISATSVPIGASLYVDTIYQGYTNQIVGNLAVGTHTVTMKKSGYKDFSQTATVYNAQTTSVSVTLSPVSSPTTGDLDVSSTPSGASVYLNGDYQGETRSSGPLYITSLVPGTYTVILKKSGYQDYTTTAKIVAGTTAQVAAVLQPASAKPTTASAEIYSQPSGADIYINNAYKGVTPLSLENVPIDATKTYSIEIRMEGYKTYTDSGSISPGQTVVINAALTPLPQQTTKSPLSLIPIVGALVIMGLLSVVLMKKR
jgi:PEGA domain